MAKQQLKDFLLCHLVLNTYAKLLWWKSISDETFYVNLADGRKKRNDSSLAALAKAWERANGRDAGSNSKMNLKEALKHCPYIEEISRNRQSGIYVFRFVEKACPKKRIILSTEEPKSSEIAYESLPLSSDESDAAEQIEKVISKIMQNNSNFCGNVSFSFSLVSGKPSEMTVTFSNLSPSEVVSADNCCYLSLDHGYSASEPIQQMAYESSSPSEEPNAVSAYEVATANQIENCEMIEQQVNSPSAFSAQLCDNIVHDHHTNMDENLLGVEGQTDHMEFEEASNVQIAYESFSPLEDLDAELVSEFGAEIVNLGSIDQLPDLLEELLNQNGISMSWGEPMPLPYTN